MSRKVTVDKKNKTVVEEIVSMDECRSRYNDVCCEEDCYRLGYYVPLEFCETCKHFQKEDGIITER